MSTKRRDTGDTDNAAFDELSLHIGPIQKSDYGDGVYFLVTVRVNGAALPDVYDVLDVDEFFASLALPPGTTARLPVFNCTCGCFGCGGFYTDVTVTPNALVWENAYGSRSAREEPWQRWRYRFAWDSVQNAAGELLAAFYTGRAHSAHDPYAEESGVRYGTTGVDMAPRLLFYLERYHALPGMA